MNKNEIDDLILRNTGLIKKCMKDLHSFALYADSEEEFENTYYAGLIALVKNAKNYNPEIATEGTFFYKCIRNGILRYFYFSNMQKRKINKIQHSSFYEPAFVEDDSLTLEEIIPDEKINVEKEIENKIIIQQIVDTILKMKNKKNADVLCKVYGLNGEETMSYEKIAKIHGCTRENIRRRYYNALKELKEMILEGKYENKNSKKH